MMKVDIAICTWNRATMLATTLNSISRLFLPREIQLRLIVVDNNSTDNTAQVVKAHKEDSPFDVVLAHEAKQGHAFSRNKCVELADSDLMIWTDDDVSVDRHWVSSYVKAAAETDDDFWGGFIEPVLPDKPDWIAENWEVLKGCFAARDLGASPLGFTADLLPYGANFAIRTSVQKNFPFDTELGRRADLVLGEDELDLFRRLLEAGHRGSWVPESRVQHMIGAERTSERSVYKYFEGQGEALVAKGEVQSVSASSLYWTSVWQYLMYRYKKKWTESPVWVSHMIDSALAWGKRNGVMRSRAN